MLDFVEIDIRYPKKDVVEIYPTFIVKKSKDLMIKGGDFYAVWCEDLGLWSTDEDDLIRLVDNEVNLYYEENKLKFGEARVKRLYLRKSSSGMIDIWHKYCKNQLRDNYKMLNEKLIFANDPVNKKDFASIRLPYALAFGEYPAWEELISTLYSPENSNSSNCSRGSRPGFSSSFMMSVRVGMPTSAVTYFLMSMASRFSLLLIRSATEQ